MENNGRTCNHYTSGALVSMRSDYAQMGPIWNQSCTQWKSEIRGGRVKASSGAKPSLTHSRTAWETQDIPRSKQTNGKAQRECFGV